MELTCLKLNPSGNTTGLVLDPVPREKQAPIAAALMDKQCLNVEQVGFWEPPTLTGAAVRLQMMGGEFCGNASRAAAMVAAIGAQTGNPPVRMPEPERLIQIETSGHSGLLAVTVSRTDRPELCRVSVSMPLPREIRHGRHQTLGPYSLVVFDGIAHLVVWEKPPALDWLRAAEELIGAIGLDQESFGVLFYDRQTNKLTPVVTVKAVGSQVWEQSCGSGTVALLAAMADHTGQSVPETPVFQPGGCLFGSAEWDGRVVQLGLAGEIELTWSGRVSVNYRPVSR